MRISGLRPARPKIQMEFENIGSHYFELELLSKLPIAEQQSLIRLQNEYDQLFDANLDAPELSDADREAARNRLKELLDAVFERVLIKPEGMSARDFKAVKNACDDYIRSQVVRAFGVAPLQMALQEQARLSTQHSNDSNSNSTSETS